MAHLLPEFHPIDDFIIIIIMKNNFLYTIHYIFSLFHCQEGISLQRRSLDADIYVQRCPKTLALGSVILHDATWGLYVHLFVFECVILAMACSYHHASILVKRVGTTKVAKYCKTGSTIV